MRTLSVLLLSLLLNQQAFAWGLDINKLIDSGKKVVEAGKNLNDASKEYTDEEEVQLGDGMSAIILGSAPLVKDEELQRYVNRIGKWIAMQSERPNLPWKFAVIEADYANAYSLPGGSIFITRGMMNRFRSESELAGVLAHEIGHVLKKHQLRAIQGKMKAAGLMGIAEVVSANTKSDKLKYLDKVAGPFKDVILSGLDQNEEFEADQLGVVLAARAGYSPYGLVNVLQTFATQQKSPSFLVLTKTHPTANARLDRLQENYGEQLDQLATDRLEDAPRFKKTVRQ